jgi:hypothetical protein
MKKSPLGILADVASARNTEAQTARKFREYLSSFIYKGNPIISERDGQFVSIFDKENLKRFIVLQNNVQKITREEAV